MMRSEFELREKFYNLRPRPIQDRDLTSLPKILQRLYSHTKYYNGTGNNETFTLSDTVNQSYQIKETL